MNVTFFDILGIDPNAANRTAIAASLLPSDLLLLGSNFSSATDLATIADLLQGGLTFKNVRPGVNAGANVGSAMLGQISFAADVYVTGTLLPNTKFYLGALPDTGIQLFATGTDPPAQLFVSVDARGTEIIVDRLAVKLFLKSGLVAPPAPAQAQTLAADVAVGLPFAKDKVDGFAYVLRDGPPSEVDAIVRLHLLPDGSLLIEPSVPISFGPMRFFGLPAKNLFDLQLIASPQHREFYEWAHNDLTSFISNPPVKGAVGFRSIDLDWSKSPLAELMQRVTDPGSGVVLISGIEVVLEDVVVPLAVPMLPIPSHFTAGFRRKISDRSDIANAYDFSGAPIWIPIYRSDKKGGSSGTFLTLEIEKLFFRSGTPGAVNPNDAPQIEFKAALVWSTVSGNQRGLTMGIDDDWTITAGMEESLTTTPAKFTVAGTTAAIVGFTLGVSAGRLARKMPFKDSFEALVDILIATPPPDPAKKSAFKLQSATGKSLNTVMRDVGYKLGHLSMDSVHLPDGAKLVFANKVDIIVEELGWVEEANGTPYFSFTGGVDIHMGSGSEGFGIKVRRLRFRTNDDDTQPAFKIDGVFLHLKLGTVGIDGFGYVTDTVESGWAIKEWGIGVKIAFKAGVADYEIGAYFIKGSRREVATGHEFDYFLASAELNYLPVAEFALFDMQLLFAKNMEPKLGATYPDGEGMALFHWRQDNVDAIAMPRNRGLDAWTPIEHAFAFGVGCGFSFVCTGKLFTIDFFVFYAKAPDVDGLLVVGELHLFKSKKAIAFVAVDYDFKTNKYGVMIGLDLKLADIVTTVPAWLGNLASLSGTLYFGNKPSALAIGQLADQRSWLGLTIEQSVGFTLRMRLAMCLQIVDGGVKGCGVVFTIQAGADWGIGAFILFGSFGFIAGVLKTGSHASGIGLWASFGFKIKAFHIFSFGAEVDLQITYLQNHWFINMHGEVRITGPRWLPKVTVSFDRTWSEPRPFDMPAVTQLLSGATGIEPATRTAQKLTLPGLGGALGDAVYVYSFNQLNGLDGIRITDTRDVPILSVDATIAIQLNQPVCNDSLIAESTYDGVSDAGVQRVQDVELRYGLASITVRRRPRFASSAAWTELLSAAQSGFSISGLAPQTVSFSWDHDARADGRVSPTALLMNSASPYSFATRSPQADEESVRNDLDFPCCDASALSKALPQAHIVQFTAFALGARVPRAEKFTGDKGAWWRWALATLPAIAWNQAGGLFARFSPRYVPPTLTQVPGAPPHETPSFATLGYADLQDAASEATVQLTWDAYPGMLYFEGYRGLDLRARQSVDLRTAGATTLTLTALTALTAGTAGAAGITRLVLRIEFLALPAGPTPQQIAVAAARGTLPGVVDPSLAGIGVFRISYVGLADTLRFAAMQQRCKNGGNVGPPGSDGHGKLAFLPNHDYEVVVTGSVAAGTRAQGTRSKTLSEALYFRTKGLPGLNACGNTGDDIRLHVDTTYAPRRDVPLYREEPCALAFENSLSSVLPIDRAPAGSDPPEKAQMFELMLNVDRVVSMDGLKRLTVPSGDWILQHRAHPYPAPYALASDGFAKAAVRLTGAHDPQVRRLEALKAGRPACGPQNLDHPSQVLLHEPIDGTGAANPWEAATGYRATVRQKNGPYAERTGFDAYDLAAFIAQADGGASAPVWSVDAGGNLVAPGAASGRSYAAIGELDWDHLQVHARVDLRTASAAGIAVGVGNGSPVPQAALATIESTGGGNYALVLRLRTAAGEQELARASVTLTGPALLTVVAFDDAVRATVGDVSVEGARGAVRAGRVALVANGAAAFAGIAVDGLDIYAFEFITSKYSSFGEHLDSYDGTLPVFASGAFGGMPATAAAVLAARGAQIAPVMQSTADPQARQRLFDGVVMALGIGMQKYPTSVAISRLTDAGGTFGFLVQSPEPISLTRDVTLALQRHVSASDVPVATVALANGAETSILLLSANGVGLGVGTYTLRAVMDRDRWQANGSTNPEQHYHQERTITLQW